MGIFEGIMFLALVLITHLAEQCRKHLQKTVNILKDIRDKEGGL